MKKKLLLFFTILQFHLPVLSQSIIRLDNPTTIQNIGLSVDFLEDQTNNLTIEEIISVAYQSKFKPSKQENPNFGNTKSTIWGRLIAENKANATWLLKVENPMLDEMQFFYPTQKGYEIQKTGAAFPFHWRSLQTNSFIFQLSHEKDSSAVRTYYFRVQSNFPIELPLKIATWKPFFEQHHRDDVAYGFYFGLMFVMGLYNFFVFVSVRDKTYLYYVGYVFSITVLYGALKGYSSEFLWKNYESINFFVPILASIPPIFGILFATSFLHTQIYTPKLHKIAYFLFALFAFCILLNLFGDYAISAAVSQLGAMLFVLYFLLIGIVCLFRKNKAARFFLLAWICYIVAVIIFILQINGVLNSNTFTSNSVLFGSAIEVILLSFALADKIATLKKEKEASLLANEKLIKDQKEVLTLKVQEQTRELLETNEELRNSSEELHAINDELQKTLSVVNLQKAEIDLKHGELQNSYRSVNVLSEIGKQVNATLDLRTIIRTVYANINKLMSAEIFGIGIYRENEKLLEFDGFMENGEELAFHTESLADNSRYAVRCFLTSHEIILHHVSEEVPNYEVQVGLKPESMLYLPLMYQNKTLGVITVQSLQPHAYNDYHLTMLRSIASYTSSALDNALSYREIEKNKAEIEKKNEDITASISYAQRIQNAMLPTQTQLSEVLGQNNFFVFFKPRDIVSGDFYWTATMRGDLVIAVADCTGHGVPGAFVSMIGSSFLDEIVLSNGFTHPTTVLKHLNKKIIDFFKQKTTLTEEGISDGMDIAILSLYKSKNTETHNKIRFEKALFAGAMNPLYYIQNQTLTEIKATKKAIGGHRTLEKINFESTEIDLTLPTIFYLFSDGYQDQFGGEKNKKFMTANFRRLIDSVHTKTFEQQNQLLETTLKNWQGTEKQTDDICVLGFSV